MKIAIITTTINYPYLLIDYAKDFIKNKKKHDLIFVVAGDNKTPSKTYNLSEIIKKKYDLDLVYLDKKKQNTYLSKFKKLKKFLPWNSVQRRNVALLYAYEKKAEVIITIDDDNFLHTKNFTNIHVDNLFQKNASLIKSKEKWFNVCSLLKEKNNNNFFHRGFPISKKKFRNKFHFHKVRNPKIAINAGFWFGDPDIDAVSRLSLKLDAIGYKLKKNFLLNKKNCSPFNSQNTALISQSLPAYFLSPHVGRLDDIYASYIMKKICDFFNYHISYGFPIVKQIRNQHNIWKDLDLERLYHEGLEDFLFYIDKVKINNKKKNFQDATEDLLIKLKKLIVKDKKKINKKIYNFLIKFLNGYLIWVETVKKIKK